MTGTLHTTKRLLARLQYRLRMSTGQWIDRDRKEQKKKKKRAQPKGVLEISQEKAMALLDSRLAP